MCEFRDRTDFFFSRNFNLHPLYIHVCKLCYIMDGKFSGRCGDSDKAKDSINFSTQSTSPGNNPVMTNILLYIYI